MSMTFDEVLKAVQQLSDDEQKRLRAALDTEQPAESPSLQAGTMNVDALLAAVDDMRAGLSDDELDEIVAAMNEEYIESVDDTQWDQ